MPLIGEGTYGCVFKPVVSCKVKKNIPKDSVGKVFVNYFEYDLEKEIQEKIKIIDPKNNFTVPLYNSCYINKFSQHDKVSNCTLIKKNDYNTEYPQLIYKYGGIDLKNLLKNEKGSIIKFMKLFIKFRPILIGIKKMLKYNYIHQDIKPGNILYNKKSKKLFLIDFGILTNSSHIYTHSNSYALIYNYPYYPPEYKLFNFNGSFNKYYNIVLKNYKFNFIIQNKNINLLKIIHENIGIDIVNNLKTVYDNLNSSKKIFNPNKVDLFSIGIVILELYVWSGLYNKKESIPKNKILHIQINEFLKGLISFNSLERYDINKTINKFDEIVQSWENIT
jgi:serine/threonine protein kinase